MKIIIKEDKRDRLAKRILTDEFSDISQETFGYKDSMGGNERISFYNGDNIIMLYGVRTKSLYFCDDVTQPILYFSYGRIELKRIVSEWFSDTFGLPVTNSHYVRQELLN